MSEQKQESGIGRFDRFKGAFAFLKQLASRPDKLESKKQAEGEEAVDFDWMTKIKSAFGWLGSAKNIVGFVLNFFKTIFVGIYQRWPFWVGTYQVGGARLHSPKVRDPRKPNSPWVQTRFLRADTTDVFGDILVYVVILGIGVVLSSWGYGTYPNSAYAVMWGLWIFSLVLNMSDPDITLIEKAIVGAVTFFMSAPVWYSGKFVGNVDPFVVGPAIGLFFHLLARPVAFKFTMWRVERRKNKPVGEKKSRFNLPSFRRNKAEGEKSEKAEDKPQPKAEPKSDQSEALKAFEPKVEKQDSHQQFKPPASNSLTSSDNDYLMTIKEATSWNGDLDKMKGVWIKKFCRENELEIDTFIKSFANWLSDNNKSGDFWELADDFAQPEQI